ncbi:GHMP family kinase ATP-binding protein [Candidatus Nitrosotalea okcheonensis]|uniref:D-glycero-alpha-D-manno-heptose 7-phosphate kinase n=1 Tax=Candidatus Nitrosotalea okcheonensis TaxID=1903276 RepID=A0A2H1FHQ2_9ARCH|nr:GHMP kinase [Candidatus Nitrosotalea okcheonensis]SMH72295.1 D-glycero-alpha-D-manno-heptose 7-phosphate kinase [Candidatus Nitrosotalea okcheonensis]
MIKKNEKIRCRVPLRISFAGGGTDVPPYSTTRGGAVIGSTISKYAYSTLTQQNSGKNTVIIRSLDFDLVTVLDFKAKFFDVSYDGRSDLAKAVLKVLKPKKLGFEIITACDAPPGTGLASSTAVIISLVGALKEFMEKPLTSYEIAEMAHAIERRELAIKGGHQDQYACTFGGFYFIEFKQNSTIVNPLRMKQEITQELESNLLLVDTGVSRSSSKIHSFQSKSQTDEKVIQTLDEVKKQAYDIKSVLLKGDVKSFGEMLHKSWETKKKISDIISNNRIDKIYHKMRVNGAIGGKVLGAGGGGHMLFYVEHEKRRGLEKLLSGMGCIAIPFSFENNGIQTWTIGDTGVRS